MSSWEGTVAACSCSVRSEASLLSGDRSSARTTALREGVAGRNDMMVGLDRRYGEKGMKKRKTAVARLWLMVDWKQSNSTAFYELLSRWSSVFFSCSHRIGRRFAAVSALSIIGLNAPRSEESNDNAMSELSTT